MPLARRDHPVPPAEGVNPGPLDPSGFPVMLGKLAVIVPVLAEYKKSWPPPSSNSTPPIGVRVPRMNNILDIVINEFVNVNF